jgi:hypothetical protein
MTSKSAKRELRARKMLGSKVRDERHSKRKHHMPAQPEQVIVAVHGIGEPVRCQTIQAVAYQFCKYFGAPANIPLGRFSAELIAPAGAAGAPGAFMVKTPPDPQLSSGLGFAEVYWADVPRGPAKDLYTLEEAKKWAKTIVERVQALDREETGRLNLDPKDYLLIAQVIEEMIETTRVLGRLMYLAEKAGLFKFNLNKVLVDYLGDVQVVAEFSNYRAQIVGQFQKVLERVNHDHPKADIHIVSHSEGTVIAFMGLLDALHKPGSRGQSETNGPARPPWVDRVRGIMTIGSPINKHLLLWPELWRDLKNPLGPPPDFPIQWRNYYDFGDPIGYRLDTVRTWLHGNGWQSYFAFNPNEDDIGFTRYYFAGKAHNDYWEDEGVFGHFIQTVVKPPKIEERQDPKTYARPSSHFLASLASPTLPYVLSAALVFLGVYLLYKAVGERLTIDENFFEITKNVCGISYLLIGITVAVRIPRLTRHCGWRLVGLGLFLSSVCVFPGVVTTPFLHRIGSVFLILDSPFLHTDYVIDIIQNFIQSLAGPVERGATVILCFAGLAFLTTWLLGVLRPSWGAKPLLFLGCSIIFSVVAGRLLYNPEVENQVKTAFAEQAGLSGSKLGEATHETMTKLAGSQVTATDFEKMACNEATKVINHPKFAESVNLVRIEPGPTPNEARLRTALSEQAGLGGSELDEATNETMKRIKADPGPSGNFDQRASKEATLVIRQNKFAESVKPPPRNDQIPAAQPISVKIDTRATGQTIWPVILAGTAFLYLWFLATLLFDLVVVWQHYIRNSAILNRLQDIHPVKSQGLTLVQPATKPEA